MNDFLFYLLLFLIVGFPVNLWVVFSIFRIVFPENRVINNPTFILAGFVVSLVLMCFLFNAPLGPSVETMKETLKEYEREEEAREL